MLGLRFGDLLGDLGVGSDGFDAEDLAGVEVHAVGLVELFAALSLLQYPNRQTRSGRYDGTVGVLGALHAIEGLQAASWRPRLEWTGLATAGAGPCWWRAFSRCAAWVFR